MSLSGAAEEVAPLQRLQTIPETIPEIARQETWLDEAMLGNLFKRYAAGVAEQLSGSP